MKLKTFLGILALIFCLAYIIKMLNIDINNYLLFSFILLSSILVSYMLGIVVYHLLKNSIVSHINFKNINKPEYYDTIILCLPTIALFLFGVNQIIIKIFLVLVLLTTYNNGYQMINYIENGKQKK